MKLVILSLYKAFPPVSGAATVSYNVAKYLPGEKHLIQLGDKNLIKKLGETLTLHSFRHRSERYLLKMLYFIIRVPRILALVRSLAPDAILLEGASWSVYYLFLFYLFRLFSPKAKIVYHAHIVEHVLRGEKNNAFIAWVTRWAEGILMTRSDLATAVSEVDAKIFKQTYGFSPYIFFNGVDIDKFSSVPESQVDQVKTKYGLAGLTVLFMGITTFGPNREAVHFLLNDVFPGVIARKPGVKLAIIGGRIAPKREWLINPGNIPFEEVPLFVNAAHICLAPIFSGSGTRLKILEYLAAGKPVVSTAKGAEGLAVADKKNIFIVETAEEFIQCILSLIDHPDRALKVSQEARRMVQNHYSWEKILGDFYLKLEGIVRAG